MAPGGIIVLHDYDHPAFPVSVKPSRNST